MLKLPLYSLKLEQNFKNLARSDLIIFLFIKYCILPFLLFFSDDVKLVLHGVLL